MRVRVWFFAVCLFALSTSSIAEDQTTPDPIAALLAGDYAKLDLRMQSVQESYKRGTITDEQLLAAFRPFYDIEPADAPHLTEWIGSYPNSYVARLARGIYYKHLGRRYGQYLGSNQLLDERIGSMQQAQSAALDDLYDSMELDDRPLLSYFHLFDLTPPFWQRQPKQLLADAIAIDPRNFMRTTGRRRRLP